MGGCIFEMLKKLPGQGGREDSRKVNDDKKLSYFLKLRATNFAKSSKNNWVGGVSLKTNVFFRGKGCQREMVKQKSKLYVVCEHPLS